MSNVGGLLLRPYSLPAKDPDQVIYGRNVEADSNVEVAEYDEIGGKPQWLDLSLPSDQTKRQILPVHKLTCVGKHTGWVLYLGSEVPLCHTWNP